VHGGDYINDEVVGVVRELYNGDTELLHASRRRVVDHGIDHVAAFIPTEQTKDLMLFPATPVPDARMSNTRPRRALAQWAV
jgi:hypothetical protein